MGRARLRLEVRRASRFEAFRRDADDAGLWTAVAYHAGAAYASKEAAVAAAIDAVSWLAEMPATHSRAIG